jgi:hypothetical protein
MPDTQGTSMKPNTARLVALSLPLVVALYNSSARAQYAVTATSTPVASRTSPGGIPASTYTYTPSYSYWTAAYYGYPPRTYIGLGGKSQDFPYYGQPYGSPSDPWSWPAMAGYSKGIPTRYYPVLP